MIVRHHIGLLWTIFFVAYTIADLTAYPANPDGLILSLQIIVGGSFFLELDRRY